MDLLLTEEQIMLRDMARRLMAERYRDGRRRELVADGDGYSPDLWSEMAELGLLSVPIPSRGDIAGGVETALLLSELGRVMALEPVLPVLVMAGELIADCEGNSALLTDMIAGKVMVVAADGEGLFNAPLTTRADRSGASWALSGSKRTVLAAPLADKFVISAVAEGEQGVFLVDRYAPGVTLEAFQLIDDRSAAHVYLADAPGERLGQDASAALAAMRDRAWAGAAAEMLGGLQHLVAETIAYCQTRVQFRQPLSGFQVIRHRLAELSIALEEAGAAVLLAAVQAGADAGLRRRAASAAKAKVGRAARLIASQAVQLHGGMGVTEELSIGAFYKHALAFDLMFGTAEQHDQLAAAAVRAGTVRLGETMMSQIA